MNQSSTRSKTPDQPLGLRVVTHAAALREAVAEARQRGGRVGLVPTMGALHEGHLSLVDAARRECQFVVVTVFVNPTQFGPNEDYTTYPRTLEADLAALQGRGADLVFVPDVAEIYPKGDATSVEVAGPALPFEGVHRPGHFRGVATVVLKLFNLVGADIAYFGQKDYQQCQVIRQMVRDLNVPIEVRVCPTVRDPDGLALSSRNAYLSTEERKQALVLSRCLRIADELVRKGERQVSTILAKLNELIATEPSVRVDYLVIADPMTLEPLERITGPAVVAIAARVGRTRLIDNHFINLPAAD